MNNKHEGLRRSAQMPAVAIAAMAFALATGAAHARTPTKLDQQVCSKYGDVAQRTLEMERAARAGQIDQRQYQQLRRPLMQEVSTPPYSHLLVQAMSSPIETPPWIADVRAQYQGNCLQRVAMGVLPNWPGDPEAEQPQPCNGVNLPKSCFKDIPEQQANVQPASTATPSRLVTAPPEADEFVGEVYGRPGSVVRFRRHYFMCSGFNTGIVADVEIPGQKALKTCVAKAGVQRDGYRLTFAFGNLKEAFVRYSSMRAVSADAQQSAATGD